MSKIIVTDPLLGELDGSSTPIELFDLDTDLREMNDLADQYPGYVKYLDKLMDEAHTDNPEYLSRPPVAKK